MDRDYFEASKRYRWADGEVMRKRWKMFQEHQKKCRERSSRLHKLHETNRTQWEAELSKLTPAEQNRQRSLEERKAKLLARLKKR